MYIEGIFRYMSRLLLKVSFKVSPKVALKVRHKVYVMIFDPGLSGQEVGALHVDAPVARRVHVGGNSHGDP